MTEKYCVECGSVRTSGAKKCDCGHKFIGSANGKAGSPPQTADVLARIVRAFKRGRRLPYFMPDEPGLAATWWMTKQKPACERTEKPRRVGVVGKDGGRWETPYTDRVAYNLKLFLRIKAEGQRFILAAAEDGIWWNGDSGSVFRDIVRAHEAMREEGVKSYRNTALRMLENVKSSEVRA